jgi:hypothetical protein
MFVDCHCLQECLVNTCHVFHLIAIGDEEFLYVFGLNFFSIHANYAICLGVC